MYDRATSPKRGGVRFVDTAQKAVADRIVADHRSPDQLASDAFEQLLKLGTAADPDFMLGSGAPRDPGHCTRQAVEIGVGLVRIEGQAAPISMGSLERIACSGVVNTVIFDENLQALDLGREQRLFSSKQREALSVKWGGCAAPGCERPPSWTEAHHIVFWTRDKGKTNVADGILIVQTPPPAVPQQRVGNQTQRSGRLLADPTEITRPGPDANTAPTKGRQHARPAQRGDTAARAGAGTGTATRRNRLVGARQFGIRFGAGTGTGGRGSLCGGDLGILDLRIRRCGLTRSRRARSAARSLFDRVGGVPDAVVLAERPGETG